MSERNDWNAKVIEEFRTGGGVVGGPFAGLPILLLHTTGAKSGAERVNPMAFLDLAGHRYVFASFAGADHSPAWFHNLVAHPDVIVEAGSEIYAAKATPLKGEERERIYAVQAGRNPNFAQYQAKTTRLIPVVELTSKR